MLDRESSQNDAATLELNAHAEAYYPTNSGLEDVVQVGQILRNRYVLEERIGSGGRGIVFKALDLYRSSLPRADQYVALKILRAARDDSNLSVADLRRELHCGQVLSHQNIVNVFELDQDGDVVFFTMELLNGELMGDLLRRMRPASMKRSHALELIRQLGAGLAHAHERGIVHGDLKPRNLLVTRDGHLRILDFGASHCVDSHSASGQTSVLGTPAYASCEMLEGRAADARDDVYALACICYELLSGAHPFALQPATVARNFRVPVTRPPGLTRRQWTMLQRGLSFHRAGRSMGVHAFIEGLDHHTPEKAKVTPLQELATNIVRKPLVSPRIASALFVVVVIAGLFLGPLRRSVTENVSVQAATMSTPPAVATAAPASSPNYIEPPPVNSAANSRSASQTARVTDATPVKPGESRLATSAPISVDGYQVSLGDRFVEVRVHRNQSDRNTSFTWWTEPATARQGIDYVAQAKAIQSLAPQQRSTRFYVKLLPDSNRLQRNYFYVAIAEPGHVRDAEKVKRLQIWLPMAREHMQASR